MSMQKISDRPKTNIKFIKETMHRRVAVLNKLLDLGIVGECNVVIEAKESKYVAAEPMRGWINSNLLKKYSVLSERCTDTTIEDISLEGANNTMCNLEEYVIRSKLMRTY